MFPHRIMKVAVLFSGGKDSCYAAYRAQQEGHDVACLISMVSANQESYMFHIPNIGLTELQAEAMGIPLLMVHTAGEKEDELIDLKHAIQQAQDDAGIEGVVTGAVASVYQASRVQKICRDCGLWCFNPLWQMDQVALLRCMQDFRIMITGIFGYPLDRKWLGRIIDSATINELAQFAERFRINPAGEGGEIETTTLDGPNFQKHVIIQDSVVEMQGENSGIFRITEARLV